MKRCLFLLSLLHHSITLNPTLYGGKFAPPPGSFFATVQKWLVLDAETL